MKDFFVVFGGIDKLGKTTVAEIVCEKLGYRYMKFPNPDSYSGKQLRLILQGKLPFEAASFQALNFVDKLLTPITGRVIADRYTESADVYGKSDGLPEEWVDKLNSLLPQPDLTFIFTGIPFGTDNEHYDDNGNVAQGYTRYLEEHKGDARVIEIKANRSAEKEAAIKEVVEEIIAHIKRFN